MSPAEGERRSKLSLKLWTSMSYCIFVRRKSGYWLCFMLPVANIFFAGIGIAVFTPSTGAMPNNGLVISTNPGSGRRFFFDCRSNSLTVGVGDFIGLDDSPIVDEDNDFFNFQDTVRGGELSIINNVGSEDPLSASGQGVYTCRMPFEGGGEGEFNIGVYPDGFNSESICYV